MLNLVGLSNPDEDATGEVVLNDGGWSSLVITGDGWPPK